MEENLEPENSQTPQEAETPESAPQAQEVSEVSQDARNMAVLCHLLGFFTCFLGPLILWLIKKDEDAYIDKQGKEALNFQITVMLACVASAILTIICIGPVLAIAVGIADVVFVIMACISTGKGQDYKYPVSLRLIK